MASLARNLQGMVRKIERRVPLESADREALVRLRHRSKTIEAHQYIVREGDVSTEYCLIVEGFAFRQKTSTLGARQIVGIHLPGDFINLEASMLRWADYNVQALTRCKVALISSFDIEALQIRCPAIGRAIWLDTLVDASIYREWLLNIGRRDAKSRVAHLLCELGRRLEAAGVATRSDYDFPVTQEQLADAIGLTPTHVNRTLRALEAGGLIETKRRLIHIVDWDSLCKISGYSGNYLHLNRHTVSFSN